VGWPKQDLPMADMPANHVIATMVTDIRNKLEEALRIVKTRRNLRS